MYTLCIPIYVMNFFFRNGSRVRLSPWATPKAAPVHAHGEAVTVEAAPVHANGEAVTVEAAPVHAVLWPPLSTPTGKQPMSRPPLSTSMGKQILIPNLSVHFDEHFSSTFKLMINIYICVRSKYFAKDTNIEMKKNQTRQKLNRLVLFRHL